MSYKEGLRGVEESFIKRAAGNLAEKAKAEPGGFDLGKACTEALRAANVKVRYVRENEPGFNGMRNQLQTEPGLVISNHPGWPDTLAVLQAIDRDDVLILSKPEVAKAAGEIFGRKYFLPASTEPRRLVSMFSQIEKHIHSGGLFVLFPTGGRSSDFKSGMRVVLSKMEPQDMVYCFNVNSGDVKAMESSAKARLLGAASESAVEWVKNPYRLAETAKVRVNEEYTMASEWRALLSGSPKATQDRTLQRHYAEKFGQVLEAKDKPVF